MNIPSAESSEQRRIDAVRPSRWDRPTPASKYDLVVLGGGTAGLVCAMGAAGLGARVALVERHLLGGDCLNSGCVPSKALIRSARTARAVRDAASFGIRADEPVADFDAVMRRMRARRADLAPHDAARRLAQAGVHVFFGEARFAAPDAVAVDGLRLRFRRAVIATGTRPAVPVIAGLDGVRFLTSETAFDLASLPRHLVVVGAGPIGCELAQVFARFGSAVTLLEQGDRILPRDSPEAAGVVSASLRRDGVRLEPDVVVERVEQTNDGVHVYVRRQHGGGTPAGLAVTGDALLLAAGRIANVEGLGLDEAAVSASEAGVVVNDRLQTSNRRIFASGDVCSAFRFTHAADAMSRIVVQNALFFGRRRASALVVPWVTFTDPEVGHVGITHRDVAASGGRFETITIPMRAVDRAVVDEETDGFVSMHHERGRLRGCTIVSAHAGEMMGEAVYALTHRGTMAGLSATVHAYPTYAEAFRKAGDEFRRQALTPAVRRALRWYFDRMR